MNRVKKRARKTVIFISCLLVLLLTVIVQSSGIAQTTTFTYQGKLTDAGNPANGTYDMQFKLFDTATVGTGTQQGATITNATVQVSAGNFSVTLDFGATVFTGSARFLEIGMRPAGSPNPYTVLAPRQPINSVPYATKSQKATIADELSLACVNCVTNSQIASVNGSAVSGTIPVASVPAGSNSYIQNTNSQQATSNFNISGNGIIGGNVGIGTSVPLTKLDVRGNLTLDPGASPMLFTSVASTEQNRFLHLMNSPLAPSASGLKAGGLLVSDAFDFANPGKNDLIVKGQISVGSPSLLGRLHVYSPGSFSDIFLSTGSGSQGAARFRVQADSGLSGQGPSFVIYDDVAAQYRLLINGYGDVGIGTNAPRAKLHVVAGYPDSDALRGESTNGYGVMGVTYTGTGVYGFSNFTGVDGFSPGYIGVRGVSTSGWGVYGYSENNWAGYFDGNVRVTGTVTAYGYVAVSDARLKQGISKLNYGLAEVLRLRPVTWRWKDRPERGLQLGLVAQEVEPVLPELVSTDKGIEQTKGLNYAGLLPVLVNAIKEQQAQIEKQAQEINRLKQLEQQQSKPQQSPIQLRQQLKQQRGEISRLKQLICLDHPKAVLCRERH